jgi:hypothetical protein
MKFIEHLKAVDTGNKQVVLEPLCAISFDVTPTDTDWSPRFAKEYSITVRLGASQYIEEDVIKASDGRVIEYAVEEMKHAIMEELYGELRRDLIDLQREMRNQLDYYDNPCRQKLVEIIEKVSL